MAPGSAAAEESALVAEINNLVNRIMAKTTELANSINSKIGGLPGWLQDKVIEGWNKFTAFLKEVWDALVEVFTNMGSPSALNTTADSWSNSVGGPVSAKVQTAMAGSLLVDDNWDGTAADSYRQNLPLQEKALDKIKANFSDGIGTALGDVVKGIYTFWGGLAVALIAFVGGMIAACASAATIVGLPAGPFIAAGAALAAAGAFASGGLILKGVCAATNTTLQAKFNDNTGYLNEHWPPATCG